MSQSRPIPSERELQILRVLWRRGASTVREVHEALGSQADVEYNTVGKLLQIMDDKGLVARNERERAHRYTALVAEDSTQATMVRDLLARAFDGSAAGLVLRALEEDVSAEDLERIRRVLDELEAK